MSIDFRFFELSFYFLNSGIKFATRGGNRIKKTLKGQALGCGLVRQSEFIFLLSFRRAEYVAVDELELNRLFDRFYRADKARKFASDYGVGLSRAKAIVEKHKGEITAYKKDATHIGIKVVLKNNRGLAKNNRQPSNLRRRKQTKSKSVEKFIEI